MSDRLYLSTRKGLFTAERGARGWTIARAAFLGDNVSLMLADPRDGRCYAALDHGHFGPKLHRSANGVDWEEIACPVYPEQPDPENGEEPDPHPWSVVRFWSLEAGGADQPGRLWAGSIPGGLFRSDDHGESWQLVDSLWSMPERRQWTGGGAEQPGIHSICVDPRDARRIGIGVSVGGVWISDDDGATWAVRSHGMRAAYLPEENALDPIPQDPHCVVQCPSAPEHWWCQHHNGIFRSTDDSTSWTEISEAGPSTFGFPVAVHPLDPLTAWFVPAHSDQHRIPVDGKVVVTRTTDGGATFDTLRTGLPQDHAYDLTFRHALAVDPTGARLAFGTSTGNVYVSEDAGDTWHAIAFSLPPIYAARFGAR